MCRIVRRYLCVSYTRVITLTDENLAELFPVILLYHFAFSGIATIVHRSIAPTNQLSDVS